MFRVGHVILLTCIITLYLLCNLIFTKKKWLISVACFCLSAFVVAITVCFHIDTDVLRSEYKETFSIRFLLMDAAPGQVFFEGMLPGSTVRQDVREAGYWWGTFVSTLLALGGAVLMRKSYIRNMCCCMLEGILLILGVSLLNNFLYTNFETGIQFGFPFGFLIVSGSILGFFVFILKTRFKNVKH